MARKGCYILPLKWRYLIDEPYDCTNRCCDKLKKDPFKKFEHQTGRSPILGMMASESQMRAGVWLRHQGCNYYGERSMSNPLSVWTEKDILEYVERYNLEIAEVYHQGANRTGCVGCGFSIQFEDKFDLLYKTYPKLYSMVMNYTNNGVTFREAVRKALAKCNKTLPDERNELFN